MNYKINTTKQFITSKSANLINKTSGYLGVNYEDFEKEDLINIIHLILDFYHKSLTGQELELK